jgi:hypothetical protein
VRSIPVSPPARTRSSPRLRRWRSSRVLPRPRSQRRRELIEREREIFLLTAAGAAWLDDLGVVKPPRAGKACNDWSECRRHLAGGLGVAIAQRLFELEWLTRGDRPRLVEVTAVGRRELARRLGVAE